MIITRSPLRISLGGGGTDLPSYYRKHTGFLIAAAIDKYVCITLHHTFEPGLILKYSSLERVSHVDEVQHPIIRECLRFTGVDGAGLEITSMADIPAGTGLGSSGSFTTALLKALHAHRKNLVQPRELAEHACHIELDRLGEPIGKQDQYVAAFGGLTCFQFLPDDQVQACPLQVDPDTLYALEDNLLLFFTGYSRSASGILQEQDTRSQQRDQGMEDNLHFVKELGYESKEALERGDLRRFAELMNVHWQRKKERSGSMSNPEINRWYDLALENGALGGKLIGAGGGGFLMFYAEKRAALRQAMAEAGLREVRFRFDFEGTKVLFQGEAGLPGTHRLAA
jgi:D-glycero-alpha-D-manno-heptose-7-phosphate kinase